MFYKHYLRVDNGGRISYGFSEAAEEAKDGDVLLTEQGDREFRLSPDGEDSPRLRNEIGIPLYKWDGERVLPRSPEEIAADTPKPAGDITGDIIAALVDLEYRMIMMEMGV